MSKIVNRDNESEDDEWDGASAKLEDFNKRIACRGKRGTTIGNMIWEGKLPELELESLHGKAWDDHASEVWYRYRY